MAVGDGRVEMADMVESIVRIQRYVTGMDYDGFLADEGTCDAVGKIIGEASKQVPEDFKQAHAALPWKQMAGMRNCIVHY